MKKQYLVLMAAFLLAMTLPVGAQNNKNNQQETLVGKVSKLWKDAKKQIDKTGKDIGEKIGFDELASKKHEADLIEVDGIKYMPVYTTDHFAKLHPKEDAELVRLSREAFMQKYPQAEIIYAVVPQKDWLNTVLRDGSKVTGYRRRAYCYVVAKDGTEGYLNACFLFMADREAGNDYVKSKSWPRRACTDAVPSQVYPQLIR